MNFNIPDKINIWRATHNNRANHSLLLELDATIFKEASRFFPFSYIGNISSLFKVVSNSTYTYGQICTNKKEDQDLYMLFCLIKNEDSHKV